MEITNNSSLEIGELFSQRPGTEIHILHANTLFPPKKRNTLSAQSASVLVVPKYTEADANSFQGTNTQASKHPRDKQLRNMSSQFKHTHKTSHHERELKEILKLQNQRQ